jgi:acetoin utilization protein AcuB
MHARDVMTTNVLTGSVRSTLAQAIDTMVSSDVRHLPIVSGDELIGMISDRDLRQFSRDLIVDDARARAKLAAPVTQLMSSDVLTADPEDDLDDLIELMIENKVGAVPVVDGDGQLVGIVSYIDILRAAHGRLP